MLGPPPRMLLPAKENALFVSRDGLFEFSHVEVLFYLHGVDESSVITGRRHPRGDVEWPEFGIFAPRAKKRPDRIAATICQVEEATLGQHPPKRVLPGDILLLVPESEQAACHSNKRNSKLDTQAVDHERQW